MTWVSNVNYYFADHLDTAGVVANSSGTILDDSDFYPAGGGRWLGRYSSGTIKNVPLAGGPRIYF